MDKLSKKMFVIVAFICFLFASCIFATFVIRDSISDNISVYDVFKSHAINSKVANNNLDSSIRQCNQSFKSISYSNMNSNFSKIQQSNYDNQVNGVYNDNSVINNDVGPFCITDSDPSDFRVKTEPIKIFYEPGEDFDPTGLECEVEYRDGTTKIVTPKDNLVYSPTSFTEKGTYSVTIKYFDSPSKMWLSCLLGVIVDQVQGISIANNPNKMSYRSNEKFDPSGMVVTAQYSCGGDVEIKDYTYNESIKEDGVINISYKDYYGQQFTTKLQVTTIKLDSIEIAQLPNNLIYFIGDTIDLTGIVVIAHYTDGASDLKFTSDDMKDNDNWVIDPIVVLSKSDYSISIKFYDGWRCQAAMFGIMIDKLVDIQAKVDTSAYIYHSGEYFDDAKSKLDLVGIFESGRQLPLDFHSKAPYTIKIDPARFSDSDVNDKCYMSVTYTNQDNVVTKSNAFWVTVKARTPQTMKITKAPNKVFYYKDENFDPTGMKVEVTYDYGDPRTDISIRDSGKWTPTSFKEFKDKNVDVTISYTENKVTVSDIQPVEIDLNYTQALVDSNGTLKIFYDETDHSAEAASEKLYWSYWTVNAGSGSEFPWYGNTDIKSVNVSGSDSMSKLADRLKSANGMFSNLPFLTDVNISNSPFNKVSTIDNMFNGSKNLQHIYWDDNVSGLGMSSKNMFKDCTLLPCFDKNKLDKTYAFVNDGNHGYFVSKNPKAKKMYEFKITTLATKTQYKVGESFSTDGMECLAKYNDGTSKTIKDAELSKLKIDPATFVTTDTKEVSISYTDCGCTKFDKQKVEVQRVLESIKVTKFPRIDYIVGQTFDPTGIEVTATYNDIKHSTEVITDPALLKFDNTKFDTAGKTKTQDVIIGYDPKTFYEDEIKTCILEVNVTPQLVSLALDTTDVKKDYFVNDTFSCKGLKVIAVYNDPQNKEKDVTKSATIEQTSFNVPGNASVNVSYEESYDKQKAEKVKVNASINDINVNKKLLGIRLDSEKAKKDYFVGDDLDVSNVKIFADYNYGDPCDVTKYDDRLSFTPKNFDKVYYEVKVKYTEDYGTVLGKINQEATYDVNVTYPLESISIEKQPDKTIYYENEIFDPSGIIVQAYYSNSDRRVVENYTFDEKALTTNDDHVDISYTEKGITKTASVKVTVKPNVESIEITQAPDKIEYMVNDDFDPTGMVVVANYKDDSHVIDNYVCSPNHFTEANPSTEVVVSYTEGPVTKTDSIIVSVKNYPLTALLVDKKPDKTTYYEGDTFDPTGMIVEACYSDDSRRVVDSYKYKTDPLTVEDNKIELIYSENDITVSCYVDIIVQPKPSKAKTVNIYNKATNINSFVLDRHLNSLKVQSNCTNNASDKRTF